MSLQVTLVDYGCGNILSITRALEACGAKVILTHDANTILQADRLVLPGVGAFGHCINMIKDRGLLSPLLAYFEKQRPVLGICVGMQMLLTESEEYGNHAGFGVIPGKVVKIESNKLKRKRIPSIGWSKIAMNNCQNRYDTFLDLSNEWFYFVHSYVARPMEAQFCLGEYEYQEEQITALIAKDNIIGCQFHPEKSGQAGLTFFKKYLQL